MYLYCIAFIIGSCVFSFLNVVAYRIVRSESFIMGFSYCPTCHHRLYPMDLIPIFSYLFLKGKCQYCGEKIDIRDTINECVGGILTVLCCAYYHLYEFIIVYLLLCLLDVISLIDIDTFEIPDYFHILVMFISLGSLLVFDISFVERLLGMFCISSLMIMINFIVPSSFGGGDIKLMFVCGFLLGFRYIVLAFIIAIILGGMYSFLLLINKKITIRKHIAFGPFLSIAIAVAMLFGNDILIMYFLCFR